MKTYKEAQETLDNLSPIPVNLPKIYFLGDTGAGKTTIIRKILGTEKLKFPTTRQTRTTVAITEYVISDSLPFMGTFLIKPEKEIRGYISEILQDALSKIYKEYLSDKIINEKIRLKHIKQTSDQRFRLYYLLSDDDQKEVIRDIESLIPLLKKEIENIKTEFPEDDDEQEVFIDLSIEKLSKNKLIRVEDNIFNIINDKVKEICDNYDIPTGSGFYQVNATNIESLITKCKPILSSEKGSISPVVEYARLQGNILAPWLRENRIEVVIIDGEGIGHNTKEAGKLDPRHYDYFYNSHSIVLVEESKKPFVAGGKSALKSISERGYADKLLLIFSKLDEVVPYDSDEITRNDQIEEVNDSFSNVISSLEEDNVNLNIDEDSIFYLSSVHDDEIPSVTREQIIGSIRKSIELMSSTSSTHDFSEPEYDYEMLSAFLLEPTKDFLDQYQSLLTQQHHQTIKAFNRRMSLGGSEFRMFTPISDIEDNLTTKLQNFLSSPIGWKENVTDKVKEDSINKIKRELNQLLLSHAHTIIVQEPKSEWDTANSYSGPGSAKTRKSKITSIFNSAIPNTVNSDIAVKFKDDVKDIIIEAIVLSNEKA
jgi:hypothetical protein